MKRVSNTWRKVHSSKVVHADGSWSRAKWALLLACEHRVVRRVRFEKIGNRSRPAAAPSYVRCEVCAWSPR